MENMPSAYDHADNFRQDLLDGQDLDVGLWHPVHPVHYVCAPCWFWTHCLRANSHLIPSSNLRESASDKKNDETTPYFHSSAFVQSANCRTRADSETRRLQASALRCNHSRRAERQQECVSGNFQHGLKVCFLLISPQRHC